MPPQPPKLAISTDLRARLSDPRAACNPASTEPAGAQASLEARAMGHLQGVDGEEKRALRRATMGKGAAMFLGSGDFIFLLGVGLVVSGEGKKKKFTMVFFLGSFFLYRV